MTTPDLDDKTTREASPSPSPNTPGRPRVTANPFQVRQTPSATTANDPGPFAAGVTGADRPGPADPLDTGTPSASEDTAGDREDLSPLTLNKKPVKEILRGLVLGGSKLAHARLATLPEEQEAEVWLIGSEAEAAGIADPLANIANRHAGGTLVNPDMGDLIQAALAALGYVIGNALAAYEIRRNLRRQLRTIDPEGQAL